MEKYVNDLIRESSPYLQQHAHNPVNWVPWTDDVFEKAQKENKLVLISIGYSACHWCHVMEHESFEDEEVAALMNKYFINVKIDREERPDVDQVYMTAVQLMTQRGGWPLNCFTLPDGRPVYGGTYFPKDQWMHILKSLQHGFVNDLSKYEEYANNLLNGIKQSETITTIPKQVDQFQLEKLEELYMRWSKSFDFKEGGTSKAPKFPLPSNYEFLMEYSIHTKDEPCLNHLLLTLDKMALGGIYDQIGGGFSRYSVDMLWKVPHFEKMLYDNGQLISLYSNAYRLKKKPLYKRIVYQTIEWLEREMKDDSGAFYAALDADSEGEEGKFYVWTEDELKNELGDHFELTKDLYSVNQRGYWEHNNYILLRTDDDAKFCKKHTLSPEEFEKKLEIINDTLLNARKSRIRPGLDDKCLTSWNAIVLKGLCDAYAVFKEEAFLVSALKVAKWLESSQLKNNNSLFRSYKNGKSTIDGFLEDYAHCIDAFTRLYEITFDEKWIQLAKSLMQYADVEFLDEKSSMFFYTPKDTKLIARKMEINDNVMPSSNAVMARNLFYLGKLFNKNDYNRRAKLMLSNVYDGMEMYGSGYSHWATLLNHFVFGFHEVVCNESSKALALAMNEHPIPKVVYAAAVKGSSLPITEGKQAENETRLYICTEGTCFAPTDNLDTALSQVIQD